VAELIDGVVYMPSPVTGDHGRAESRIVTWLGTYEVRWHRLVMGAYELCRPTSKGVFRSKTFPGLWLDGPALWKSDMARLLQTLRRGLRSAEHAAFVKKLAARKN
jgi:hypothetical protein